MELIGKTTINPFLFYSGKISGYITWILQLLLMMGVDLIDRFSVGYNEYLSYAILFIGLVFIVFSLINLGRSTRLGLPRENTVFKTNGLYKLSRNPMYVGFNLLTIASMTYTLNIWIIVPGIYSMVIYHMIVLEEERFLQDRFGKVYSDYRKRIRRYL